jgi:pyruvate kinase
MRKGKIIATIGPACEKISVLEKMIKAGVDVCRLNFSYGTHEEHHQKIANIRKAAAKAGKTVAIMQDLQGPKIRVGKLKAPVSVRRGDIIILTGKTEHKDPLTLPTTYKGIASDTVKGKTILMADGKIILQVLSTDPRKKEVRCKVMDGGTILTGKGINLPYTNISLPALTPKDESDAKFGAHADIDYMALSFVRTAADVLKLKRLLKREKADHIPIIAKLEKPEALDNLDEILDVVDGVMVARGDLADEISFAQVPVAQKRIIHAANQKAKITIIATEMLSSMIDNPLPTRAEVSDCANGILDGSDCLMLSNETAMGTNPPRAVKAMGNIIEETETLFGAEDFHRDLDLPETHQLSESMCAAAAYLSYSLNERAICVLTSTGSTARILSKYRPQSIIYAGTCNPKVYHKMAFYHNVLPILLDKPESQSDQDAQKSYQMFAKELLKRKLIKPGDKVIALSGLRSKNGKWNMDSITVRTVPKQK